MLADEPMTDAVDQYLARLAGHLRAMKGEEWVWRQALLDDVTAHLEHRLQAYLAAGLPRSEAAARAVEQFGSLQELLMAMRVAEHDARGTAPRQWLWAVLRDIARAVLHSRTGFRVIALGLLMTGGLQILVSVAGVMLAPADYARLIVPLCGAAAGLMIALGAAGVISHAPGRWLNLLLWPVLGAVAATTGTVLAEISQAWQSAPVWIAYLLMFLTLSLAATLGFCHTTRLAGYRGYGIVGLFALLLPVSLLSGAMAIVAIAGHQPVWLLGLTLLTLALLTGTGISYVHGQRRFLAPRANAI